MNLTDEEHGRYAAWLRTHADLNIQNADELMQHIEKETRLDEFIAEELKRDSVKF